VSPTQAALGDRSDCQFAARAAQQSHAAVEALAIANPKFTAVDR